MKVAELFILRELFWKITRQELVVFIRMTKDESIKGQPDKLLQGVQDHLIRIETHTTDPELKADAGSFLIACSVPTSLFLDLFRRTGSHGSEQ